MHVRFLLGPAGSGKTYQCLAQIRDALKAAPDGPPLVLLAPKQATFQIERQLLADADISGFTRQNIFSFDKLARFVFEQLNLAPPRQLTPEGRVMVLRALLMRHEKELQLFGRSARRPGFAAELSGLLSELQRHQFTPARLRTLAASDTIRPELGHKLLDLALLHERYAHWLTKHDLQDTDRLLDFATAALRAESKKKTSTIRIKNLWLDGFAEMTPQELDFLAVTLPFCDQATLAFCLENDEAGESERLSIWSAISKTFQECRARLTNLPGCQVTVVNLKRDYTKNRFSENAVLQTLELKWARPDLATERRAPSRQEQELAGAVPGAPAETLNAQHSTPNSELALRLTSCANPEAEAVHAAREILKFVRAGNRYRDCAVLVRSLGAHHQPLARVFRRYDIPFFLDRREAVTHHPLAEVTRSALRTVTFDWQHDDWFAALKAGFSPASETEIDRLENAALEFGWRGKKWREPLADESFAAILPRILPPFENFWKQLLKTGSRPNGVQLADAIRTLWTKLDVEATLEKWSLPEEIVASPAGPDAPRPAPRASLHATVYEQMTLWLENVALAFPDEPMSLREWLPVLEAGLSGLTIGVIPPALDQVLVGAIDRARNPDLKFTLLLGVNESIFPATPASPAILTNSDRDDLENHDAALGVNLFDQVAREHYLGYIACTRANVQLALSFARAGDNGKALNPSPFIAQLQKIFPALAIETFDATQDWTDAQHANELVPLLGEIKNSKLKIQNWGGLPELPALRTLGDRLDQLHEPSERENLSAPIVEGLYGKTLRSSVSRLEEFAQCPFKFFVKSGLRAGERKVFELDARERGNFQHDVLKIFHEQLLLEKKRWRDLTPLEARVRIGNIADEQMEVFRHGLLRDSAASAFSAQTMASALQDFVEVIVTWMREQYDFDPAQVELGFGGRTDVTPAWEIDLGEGHRFALQGRIDRVDLWRDPDSDAAFAVVTDYKSGGKKLEPLLVENGVQLQLLAYLGALRHWKNPQATFGAGKIIPAGAFYVNLRGAFDGGDTRDEVLGDDEAKKLAYRHNGRFDAAELRKFDRRPGASKGDQFNFKLNKGDGLPSKSSDAISCKEFSGLLDQVEEQLRGLGIRIFTGAAEVDPYRKGKATPCDYCEYQAVCRIDPWTHEYRILRPVRTEEATT
ncbi:MAG TPA: PD-(D/E)XK nuclease family protein [Verrucomicrobiae bacterium]|nr:PD-(D/E)XK nuclease family protein [Verrucomicrobiae bacterium]